MIPAILYPYIYLGLVTILTITYCSRPKENAPIESDKEAPFASLALCVVLTVFIGLRPISNVFGDTVNYAGWWGHVTWQGFNPAATNLIFDNIYNFFQITKGLTPSDFFLLISVIYFGCAWIACRKLFPQHTMQAYLVFLAAFSTFSYSTNGIKAGAAASIFLVAMAYRENLIVSIPAVLISWGFHHSMQLPVAAYVLTALFENSKWYFYAWLFCLAIAMLHISFFQELFVGMTDESGADYLNWDPNDDWGGKSGFRIDFVIYSAMPVIVGYYTIFKYKLREPLYETILNIYLTCNAVWMLCMYAQFTNRIAYLSWFLYPILLIYPCLKIADTEHPLVANRNKIIGAHLAFTLFMTFIYY